METSGTFCLHLKCLEGGALNTQNWLWQNWLLQNWLWQNTQNWFVAIWKLNYINAWLSLF